MPKLRESILADIIAKNIRPRPRWQYVLLHVGLWSAGIITIILGSFACALMIFEFSLPERAYLRWIETQETTDWLLALPYLWGIGMIVALTVGYFIFSKTDRSYRLHAGLIATTLIVGSLLGGILLYLTHAVHFGDREMQRFAPRYRDMREGFIRMMPRPEEGILPLLVQEIDGNTIQGQSPDGRNWQVMLNCLDDTCTQTKEKMVLNKPVIFEGKIVSKGIFEATEVSLPKPVKTWREGLINPSLELDHASSKKGE